MKPAEVMFEAAMAAAGVPPEVRSDPAFWMALDHEVRTQMMQEAEAADVQLAAAAREYQDGVRAKPGVGELKMALPPVLHDILKEDGFDPTSREDRKTVAKLFPETVVKSLPSKPTFGYTGALPGSCEVGVSPLPSNLRWRKRYEG